MRKLFLLCIFSAITAIFAGMLNPAISFAARHRIVAEGTFILGDDDSRKQAEEKALQDAMKVAVKKAGVFVKAYAEMKNHKLTESQVQTISAGLIEVNNHSTSFDTDTNGRWICHVIIDSVVDDDNIDFEALINEYRYTNDGSPAYTTPVSQGGGSYVGRTDWSQAREIVLDCRKYSRYIRENEMVGSYDSYYKSYLNLGWMNAVVRGENGIVAVSPKYYYSKGDDYNNSQYNFESSDFTIVDDIYDIPKEARNYIIPVKFFEATWYDDIPFGRLATKQIVRRNNLIIDSAIADALPRLTPNHAYILID